MRFWEEENNDSEREYLTVKFVVQDSDGHGDRRWEADTRNVSTESIADYVEHETNWTGVQAKWVSEDTGMLLSDGKKVGKFKVDISKLIPPFGLQKDGTIKL